MKKILFVVLLAAFSMPILGTWLNPTAAYAGGAQSHCRHVEEDYQGNDNSQCDEDQ